MRTINLKAAVLRTALTAAVLASTAGAALAQQVINLTAAPATTTLSDGSSVPMWGYSCGAAVTGSAATCAPLKAGAGWSPVVITAKTGDTLQINLTNNLPIAPGASAGVPTSLVIVGQVGGGLGTPTSAKSPDHSTVRSVTWPIVGGPATGIAKAPAQSDRVQSFATEIAATAACVPSASTTCPAATQLTWSSLQAGTYLIQSGTHPSIQVPMGLYGILVVTDTTTVNNVTTGLAYGTAGTANAVTYNADIPLLFSEIDPVQNAAVNTAANTAGFQETAAWSGQPGACGDAAVHNCYPPAVNYTPLYYLINGSSFDPTNAAASLYAARPAATGTVTGSLLVRMVNAGLRMHVPSIVGASTGAVVGMTLVAEDGNVLPGRARIQNEVFMAAGKTQDVLVNVPAAGSTALPIYDRQLSLSTNATGRNGGMLAYIGVNGAGLPATGTGGAIGAAVANPDTYNALVVGQPLTVSDPAKGVIANDVRVTAVSLLTQAANGTVALNGNGTFTYTPNAGSTATTDSFTYCANGSVTGTTCSSGVSATVTLGASAIANAGVTCTATSFSSNLATYLAVPTPGVLSGCTDGAGLPVTVDTASITASGFTVIADANGGFTATAPGAGSYTFTFKAKNTLGSQSVAATATVVFATPSNLQVTVLDGADHKTEIKDYRWIIEEDRTFYVDPACTTNPLPASCPTSTLTSGPINYGTNFHTSAMPVIAAGCTGDLSCESGQKLQGNPVVCDVGNGVCRPDPTGKGITPVLPSSVQLDPSKRYYISILPGDAANPFIGGNLSAPGNCTSPYVLDSAGNPVIDPGTNLPTLNTDCGHGMGGAPIPAACGPFSVNKIACTTAPAPSAVTVLTVPTPLPTATLSVFVYQDDYPLNGEHGSGGGVDVLAPQEPGLGEFQITIFDQAGGTGDVTGQPTYDMFNQPLANSLAGKIDPVTGLDACPISNVASANSAYNTTNAAAIAFNAANADAIAAGTVTAKLDTTGAVAAPKSTSTSMIVTCPKFESDGKTLSPMAGQALVKYLYPGRYGIAALPGQGRIALGEEWVQTNTLDGQKAHDSFMRVGEPGYFQEFGPAGYHVSIGFANPKIINERRLNASKSGMCDPLPNGGNLACTYEVKGKVTGSRLSRAPDSRLYSSGDRASLAFTQCYVSLGDPDGAEIAFTKCDADGNFDLPNIPAGNWKITTFDQWNDQIIDGITQPVAVGCTNSIGGLCTAASGPTKLTGTCGGPASSDSICDMGEIGVHQWQSNIYTRSFIDMSGTGVSDDTGNGSTKPGLALVATNVRFRDGSFSNFNNTDLAGYAGYNEVFPLFNWYVIETDSTRYKTTGVHVIYDAGGPADGSKSCDPAASPCGNSIMAAGLANTWEKYPLPADLLVPGSVPCVTADCITEAAAGGILAGISRTGRYTATPPNSTGRIDPPFWFGSYGWQGYIGQGNFLEFGKKPFADGETGPIHGHVVYASTRPFDDPKLLLQLSWEPLVANVTVNLYQKGVAADGVTPTLTLVDTTQTTSWDDWVQGFHLGVDTNGVAPGSPGYINTPVPNMNCPGQNGSTTPGTSDPFFYALNNQPHYLDWYNSQHGGPPATALPHGAQFKCYDGMHTWNQLQPAPYDGMYSFPSVTGFDPITGKASGTNCKACIPNPDSTDPYRAGTPMLPPGKYVVEVVVPQGYELVKEEDKNILIGDNYIAPAAVQFPGLGTGVYILPDQAQLAATYNPLNPQNATTSLGRNSALPSHEGDTGSIESYWPCVGAMRQVPDFISLFPQSAEVAPFAGAIRPLCDRKEVTLNEQTSVLTKFYLFSSTHKAAHFQGIILDDFAAEFDPFSPQFGEKFAPSYLPVGVKDWTGNAVNRVYTDQFGLYNGLNYSTWEVNPPNPTGYGPTMMVMCMNDAGATGIGATPDPLHQPGYSQFCYELPFMPGQTGYFDTPVVPTQAFASGSYNRADCSYPDATPSVKSVTGDVAGPWVSAPQKTITINALGDQDVEWYGYTGPSQSNAPWNLPKVTRHYGFGDSKGTVTIGGVSAPIASWSDTTITVTVPAGVPACTVQQQAVYQGTLPAGVSPTTQCGQLVITTAVGKQSVDTVTVTVGGKQPTVLASGATIQSAIDAAAPGDMIIVPPGTYNEMLVMWKPVRLQGVGAASSIVDANTQPAGRLLNPWRDKVVCLFGLTTDGRPDDSTTGRACASSLMYSTSAEPGTGGWINFPNLVVDRLPLEATLGWDAGLNGNLAEQMIEPSLLGAYEGAVITVVGKGVKFPTGTQILDAFGATTATPAAFPDGSVFLTKNDCEAATVAGVKQTAYPSNFYCNPSSIDGLALRDSSQGGGGVFVHAYGHNLQISNNRVNNNQGTMSGGMTIGAGEHGDIQIAGALPTQYPASCEDSAGNVPNLSLPFCFNMSVNIHHNAVTGNSSLGDEIFSSTPAGAGGVSINSGSDYYTFSNNWVCGNLSSGDGGGVSHIGFNKNGTIEHNTIIFNQSTNPTITTNGGGLLVMGAPDADPTNCGVSTDQDCLAIPGSILPSDGTGPNLKINANLILGNAADSGSGGGVRIQHVNGTDALNFPNGAAACTADLGNAAGGHCYWNSVNFTNNIVVNNVAGWDGGGVSLLDTLAINVVNNTIASNDSTASSGTLFQALFAPLASAVSPTTNVICGANNGQSCPQVAGLVSLNNSPVLQANIDQLPANPAFSCPAGHGVGSACRSYSIPLLLNDAIWQNRSFYIGVGGFGTATANQNQQHVVALFNASGTAVGSQSTTGNCPAGSSYWDIGFRGDTAATSHAASGFMPVNSVLSAAGAATYGGTGNVFADPKFTSLYCNGSRTPPEVGGTGYEVPPGVNEFNAFPNPVFSLAPAGVVDEGNNWVNVRWGPLALTNPANVTNPATKNVPLADLSLQAGSPAIAAGAASANGVSAPPKDFFDNTRAPACVDIGAVAFVASGLKISSITPSSGYRGYVYSVTLAGTGFVTGNVTGLSVPAGITVTNFQRVSDTSITATLTIGATSTLGANTIQLVASGAGCATAAATFTIANPPAPTLTSISPNVGAPGQAVNVTLTGTNLTTTSAVQSCTTQLGILFCPAGITVTNVVVVSDTSVTATLHVPNGFTLGSYSVRVTTLGGNSNAVPFTVATPPGLTGIAPNTGRQGESNTGYTILATGMAGVAAANTSVNSSNPGVTFTVAAINPLFLNTYLITGTFSVSPTAATGAGTISITTPNGVSNTQPFTVTNAPYLASIAPASGVRGATTPVVLTGLNLTGTGTTTVTVSGGGVTCTVTGTPTATSVAANCAITAGAGLGNRNMTVNDSKGTSNAQTFAVRGATVAFALPTTMTTTPGTTATKTGTVTVSNAAAATGALTLTANPTITKATGPGTFSVVAGGTCVSGAVVAPGANCTINVQYVPGASNANATANVTITGSGLATPGTLTSNNFTAN